MIRPVYVSLTDRPVKTRRGPLRPRARRKGGCSREKRHDRSAAGSLRVRETRSAATRDGGAPVRRATRRSCSMSDQRLPGTTPPPRTRLRHRARLQQAGAARPARARRSAQEATRGGALHALPPRQAPEHDLRGRLDAHPRQLRERLRRARRQRALPAPRRDPPARPRDHRRHGTHPLLPLRRDRDTLQEERDHRGAREARHRAGHQRHGREPPPGAVDERRPDDPRERGAPDGRHVRLRRRRGAPLQLPRHHAHQAGPERAHRQRSRLRDRARDRGGGASGSRRRTAASSCSRTTRWRPSTAPTSSTPTAGGGPARRPSTRTGSRRSSPSRSTASSGAARSPAPGSCTACRRCAARRSPTR